MLRLGEGLERERRWEKFGVKWGIEDDEVEREGLLLFGEMERRLVGVEREGS